MAKTRLDMLLVERNLAATRAKAQALILAGKVFSGELKLDKPGHAVPADIALEVREAEHPWVSRGGMKLAHAMSQYNLGAKDTIAIDIGASTGGFTDVLLAHGAKRVYAVDVGHGQLDWKLRNDPRVVTLEKTNARYLDRALIPEAADIVVCDASFISLTTVLPAALALTAPAATLIALIKPQFEVGKGKVGKGGVVRDALLHEEVCNHIAAWVNGLDGWRVLGITESPIRGPKGNSEFLLVACKASAT